MPDNMPNREKSKVGEEINKEVMRAVEAKEANEKITPLTDEEYKSACDYLGKDILSKQLLLKNLKSIKANYSKLKSIFSEDYDYALSLIPVTDMGNDLDSTAIANNQYLHLLYLDKESGLTHNFSWNPGYYFDLLPKKLQDLCRFSVEYKDKGPLITADDYAKLYNSYLKAYNNLRKYFGLPPFDDIEYLDLEDAA